MSPFCPKMAIIAILKIASKAALTSFYFFTLYLSFELGIIMMFSLSFGTVNGRLCPVKLHKRPRKNLAPSTIFQSLSDVPGADERGAMEEASEIERVVKPEA